MKTGYNFDQTTNIVTISAPFAKKASQIGTPEYSILLKLRKDNPNLKIEKEVKTGKAQLTYKTMEEFIALHRNSAELLQAFNGAKTLSKFHSMPFTFVKKWFEDKFPYYKAGNYELDAEGKIKVLPVEEKDAPAAAAAPVQPLEVLKNQDAEGADTDDSANAEETQMAEAV